MKYALSKSLAISGIILITAAGAASAAGPDRKKPTDGREIANLYNGKTWIWSSGGAYFGGGGKFEAHANGSVAVGKWYATSKGTLCHESIWANAKGKSNEVKQTCWRHVQDSKGVLWKEDGRNPGQFYRPEKEFNERIVGGNKIKAEVKNLRKKYGL